MKNKLSFLLLIAGGVLAALRLSAFAALPALQSLSPAAFARVFVSFVQLRLCGNRLGVRIKSSGAGSFK